MSIKLLKWIREMLRRNRELIKANKQLKTELEKYKELANIDPLTKL